MKGGGMREITWAQIVAKGIELDSTSKQQGKKQDRSQSVDGLRTSSTGIFRIGGAPQIERTGFDPRVLDAAEEHDRSFYHKDSPIKSRLRDLKQYPTRSKDWCSRVFNKKSVRSEPKSSSYGI